MSFFSDGASDLMQNCIIFGGTGFIGSHFANFLIKNNLFSKVFLVDILPIKFPFADNSDRIIYIYGDVRKNINIIFPVNSCGLIANFAAIHREPGHEDIEFYETNLLGAENVTDFARTINCKRLLFTSSISPYGVSEVFKDENTLPVPVTAYGSSKLIAEKIHQIWQASNSAVNSLIIVRPGVVFGPGEGGNVSRLIKAVLHNYFFYMGNQSTRKAGVYVKELCYAMWWVVQRQNNTGNAFILFNMTMNPSPTIKDYVDAICRVKDVRRTILSAPYKLLIAAASLVDFFALPLGIKHPFSPVRIRKLVRSNNITPAYLLQYGYQYQFSLYEAFLDWKKTSPKDWE